MSLVFYPRSHRYKLDGQWVPGVTTLLGNGLPKKALMYWSARSVAEWVADNPEGVESLRAMGRGPMVQALKEVPWQKRDTAAARGTEVHALAERIVHGEQVDVPEHLAGYVQGYVRWLDSTDLNPMWTERPVANRQWRYAGTFDLIATMRGQAWLLDVKTASGVYGDNALQLAAYANAEFLLDPDGVEIPMPAIDRVGVLHVQDGETSLWTVDPRAAETAWRDFLHAAWTANAQDRMKTYLTQEYPA